MVEGNGNGQGRLAFISWQELVKVVLPLFVGIVTFGVVVANVMLSRMEEKLKDQYSEVRELTRELHAVQRQLDVITSRQTKFYREERDERGRKEEQEVEQQHRIP